MSDCTRTECSEIADWSAVMVGGGRNGLCDGHAMEAIARSNRLLGLTYIGNGDENSLNSGGDNQ